MGGRGETPPKCPLAHASPPPAAAKVQHSIRCEERYAATRCWCVTSPLHVPLSTAPARALFSAQRRGVQSVKSRSDGKWSPNGTDRDETIYACIRAEWRVLFVRAASQWPCLPPSLHPPTTYCRKEFGVAGSTSPCNVHGLDVILSRYYIGSGSVSVLHPPRRPTSRTPQGDETLRCNYIHTYHPDIIHTQYVVISRADARLFKQTWWRNSKRCAVATHLVAFIPFKPPLV